MHPAERWLGRSSLGSGSPWIYNRGGVGAQDKGAGGEKRIFPVKGHGAWSHFSAPFSEKSMAEAVPGRLILISRHRASGWVRAVFLPPPAHPSRFGGGVLVGFSKSIFTRRFPGPVEEFLNGSPKATHLFYFSRPPILPLLSLIQQAKLGLDSLGDESRPA